MEIRKVLMRKDGVKMVIIPKHSKIIKGELVLITNNLRSINKFLEEEKNATRGKERKARR